MTNTRQAAIEAVRGFRAGLQTRLDSWPAYTGDGRGNLRNSDSDSQYMLVRWPLATSPAVEVLNESIPDVENLRVMVGYTADQPDVLRILSRADSRADNVPFVGVMNHAAQHGYLAPDMDWVDFRRILSFRVIPYSGLNVFVYGGVLPVGGSFVSVANQVVDLTASVPVSGARYSAISVATDGTITVTDGSTQPTAQALTVANVPAVPSGEFRLAAVLLRAGQTSITETLAQNDLLDLRWPQAHLESSISPSSVALTDSHIIVGNASNVGADVAMSGDATIANTGAVTLATVNSNVGSFTNASITVNAKGLITAASSGTAPITGSGTPGRVAQFATASTLGDSNLIGSGAGVLTLSAAGTYTLTVPATGETALINHANTGYFRVSSDSDSAGYFAVGAIPASVGSIRLPYASTMNFRNETNTGDVSVFWVNSGDQLRIGNSTNPLGTSIYGGTGVTIYTGGSTSVRAIAIGASTAFSMTINPDKATNASGHYLQTLINTAVYGSSVLGVYGNGRDHVYIGALDTTTGQTCTIQPFADRVALRVTGFATQTASRTLVNLIRNDANTNVVAPVITATVNSTGTAAAGLGGSIALNLESSTTADQAAGLIEWSWATATHATRKARITGKVYDTAARTWLQVDTDGATSDVLINSLIYGAMYGDDIAQTVVVASAGVYYEVGGGLTGGSVNGMTFQNSKELLIGVAGKYLVTWSMSLAAGNNDHIEGAVMINSTVAASTENAAHTPGANDQVGVGGSGILTLAVNDLLKLCIENETDADDITVSHATLTAVRIGE